MNKLKIYNEIAKVYDDLYQDEESKEIDSKIKQILCNEEELVNTEILDFGCGTGFLLDIFYIKPSKYLGVDISDGMIQKATLKYPQYSFKTGSKISKEMKDRFDVYIFLFSLNYMNPKILSEIPNGKTIYMVNLTDKRMSEEDYKKVWDDTGDNISIEELEKYIKIKQTVNITEKYIYIKGEKL